MNKIRLRSLLVFLLSLLLPIGLSLNAINTLQTENPVSFVFSPYIWKLGMILGGVSSLFLVLGAKPNEAPVRLRIVGGTLAVVVVMLLFFGQEWTKTKFAELGYLPGIQQPGLYQKFQ